ncbi:MAG: hemolysin family protein [Bacteroidia bacterium]|nr:hemolysin family protein [Bacteroidia bacterium]MCX7652940.1 hemolysin family protein [Bacteroidia bacterium]MDW8416592.1 hemolysin family protein [Bacteroidia bacterium]
MSWALLGILALLLSGWASGGEMAWISANPLYWEMWRLRYPRRWRIVQFFLKYPRRLLITLLIANNLALVGFSAAMSALLIPVGRWNPQVSFWVETIIGTLILLIVGEYLPKVFFRRWQSALLPAVVPFTALAYALLFPLVEIVYLLTRGMYAAFQLREKVLQKPLSRENLSHFVETPEPHLQAVLTKALALNETPVREFMVPRPHVVAISQDASLEELRQTFISSERSRVLVYEGDLDHIKGYIYIRSLTRRAKSIRELIEPVSFVPESMPATRLLEQLVREKGALAVVVDARGGMAGIVTTEDLVEEVFGEIQDEHEEQPKYLERSPAPGVYELDASLEIDYLNEKYALGLPTELAVTLGGLALHSLGYIPPKGTVWEAYGFRWEVLSATQKRVITLRLQII